MSQSSLMATHSRVWLSTRSERATSIDCDDESAWTGRKLAFEQGGAAKKHTRLVNKTII